MLSMPRPTPALLFIAVSLLAANWSSSVRAADQASTQLEDLVVTGERTGPGMWHVHRGSAQAVDIGQHFAIAQGHYLALQAGGAGTRHHQHGAGAQALEIGIVRILWLLITEHRLLMVGGGKRLKDVMPPNLYARFALEPSPTRRISKSKRYRPIVATAFLQRRIHQVGLSARLDLGAAVRNLRESTAFVSRK